jgi:iron complex outermembrane recepter protein
MAFVRKTVQPIQPQETVCHEQIGRVRPPVGSRAAALADLGGLAMEPCQSVVRQKVVARRCLVFVPILLLAGWLIVGPSALGQQTPAASPSSSPAADPAGGNKSANDVLNMDLDQLAKAPVVVPSMDIPVSSVTKETSTVGRSPAAVFVITQEMIRRSGVTSIPEALRMAPGVDVARINSNTWAISIRGFNGIFANKLLVLMDGRILYSPVNSGVYWDVQDYPLLDIERIEVIRGPGGTLWGCNAVNGVINIITKRAKDTQGALVDAIGGSIERANGTARYGGEISDDCQYRVYAKYFDRNHFYEPNPALQANDAWNQGRFGFRSDWNPGGSKADTVTFQGDVYRGQDGQDTLRSITTPPFTVIDQGLAKNDGEDILAHWRHVNDDKSDWELLTYFDDYERLTNLLSERVRTWDIEYQHRFPVGDRHEITWGAGYRYMHYYDPSMDKSFEDTQPEGSLYVISQFVQDEIALSPDFWTLTLGCKLEENNYTGLEYQPTARLIYTPDRKHSIWGAISRAVRMPDPIDRFGLITTRSALFPTIRGNPGFQSETLIAYEAGYRVQATDTFSYDIATFYNSYDRLQADVQGASIIQPHQFINGSYADTYGVEVATNLNVTDHWRLRADYANCRMIIVTPVKRTAPLVFQGDTPKNQAYIQSSWDLGNNVDFDLIGRYVDCLQHLKVPAYFEMDMRLAWRPRKHLELAVVGQNLLQARHFEWGQSREVQITGWEVTEVPRSVYGEATYRY